MIEFGPFRYDPEARLLYRGDEEIALPTRVVAVLESFLKRPGRIVAKDDILASAWEGAFVGEDSLTQAVSQLRSALGDDPRAPTYIQTIPKRGYRLIAEVSAPLQSTVPVPRPAGDGADAEAVAGASPAAPPSPSPAASPGTLFAESRQPSAAAPGEQPPIFAPGASVSHYELVTRIGAGAMGEVWRARDTELQRDVAIKVVPGELAGEAAVIERFRREALMLGAVNHPNIATIHGVEQVNGTRFIVMELLEGETLQERIERGALPIGEALDIAVQITRALEVAHDSGIVHRDLKPGNIMVAADRQVKVLDFGLAKDVRSADGAVSTDPTALTATGLPIGTAAYMSPEQAAARPIDKRSDIFSFGCVVFEMLAGQRPFGGTTASEVVAGILKDEPAWSELADSVPRSVRRLLRRSLEKNPDHRLHDIADARLEIEQARTFDADTLAVEAHSSGRLPWAVAAASTAIAVVAITAVAWLATRETPERAFEPVVVPTRTTINLPEDAPLAPPGSFNYGSPSTSFALSPDARTLVYVAWREGAHELWRYDMSSGGFSRISDTSGAYEPFFEPAGEQVGFFADKGLKAIPLNGSRSRWLADVVWGRGGTWGADGFIYFTPNQMTGVHRVSAGGSGQVEQITYPSGLLASHDRPILVKGRGPLLFEGEGVQRLVLDGSAKPETLIPVGAGPMVTDTGHLLWGVDGVLVASPVGDDGLPILESPVSIVDDAMARGNRVYAHLAGSTLVYVRGPNLSLRSFMWVSGDNVHEPLDLPVARYNDFQISPDGRWLAYTLDGAVWLLDLDVPNSQATGQKVGCGWWPEWHPSGESLYFTCRQPDGAALFRLDLAAPEPVEVIPAGALPDHLPGPVTEGGLLYYQMNGVGGRADIRLIPFEEDGLTPDIAAIKTIVATPGEDVFPSVSPDGRWLAYESDLGGVTEIYVTDLAGGRQRKVTPSGGEEPRWSPDGKSILYQDGRLLYSVAFRAEPDFAFGEPVVVASGPFADVGGWGWDVARDGRFLVLENAALGEPITQLVVITGFLEKLERRFAQAVTR